MKRIIIMLVIAAMLLAAMAGCGSAASTAESAASTTESAASAAQAPEETAEGPETVAEAVYGSEPQTVTGDVYGSEPQTVTEDVYGSQPQTVAEDVYGSEPQTVAEDVNGSEPEAIAANIGDVTFAFTNQGEYYDVTYRYPAEFELEVKEDSDRVRHALRYNVEGYEPPAVGLVISRSNDFSTPEERLADISWTDDIVTEEINGTSWAIGTQTDTSEDRLIIYACAVGEYIYTFSFSSDYPADFDFTDFARVFAENVRF